jgi:ferredoxin
MDDFKEKYISNLKIKIDRTTCISTGNCVKAAPEVFELDDERICSFKIDLIEIPSERLIEACSVCPVDALFAFHKNGKIIVPEK